MQKQLDQWVTNFQRFGKTNMDFAALQQKLFDLDPSDRAEDLRRLTESVGDMPQESAQTEENFVQESVEIAEGTMPVEGDYSLSDFAALAGVTLNESQKTGSAGQLKGKDPMPKAKARGKHPHVDKLVGEADIEEGFKDGWDNAHNIELFKKMAGDGSKEPKSAKAVKTATRAAPDEKAGLDGSKWKAFLKKHTVSLQSIAADPKKTQRFETWLTKWNEDVQEAPKPKTPKARNPVASHAQSSGSGVHRDQHKKKQPMRKDKHKKQLDFATESIKEMLYRKLNAKK